MGPLDGEEVEGEKDAVDDELVGGEELLRWEGRVTNLPELELW